MRIFGVVIAVCALALVAGSRALSDGSEPPHPPVPLDETGGIGPAPPEPFGGLLQTASVLPHDDERGRIHQSDPLDPQVPPLEPISVDRGTLSDHGLSTDFATPGLAVTESGTVPIVSGRDDASIEVDRAGRVLAAAELSGGRHPRSEGVETGPDGVLYISDERNGKEARLTLYASGGREPS